MVERKRKCSPLVHMATRKQSTTMTFRTIYMHTYSVYTPVHVTISDHSGVTKFSKVELTPLDENSSVCNTLDFDGVLTPVVICIDFSSVTLHAL